MSAKTTIAPRQTNVGAPLMAAPKVTQILTSKEWVLPPRPKPGRKPSVDTPASKRKAQNRAAQRAFRERRATRVQELEAKLVEVERENEVKEMALINNINKLKIENQFLLKSLNQLKQDYANLKHATSNPESPSNNSNNDSPGYISPAPSNSYHSPQDNYGQSSPLNREYPTSYSPKQTAKSSSPSSIQSSSNFTCGVCVKDDCLCESVGLKVSSQNDVMFNKSNPLANSDLLAVANSEIDILAAQKSLEEQLNSFKPEGPVMLRKRKSDGPIDFTDKFKSKPMPDLKRLKTSSEVKTFGKCGFCTDDSDCVCLEVEKETSLLPPLINNNIRKSSLPVMHPGPSVGIRDFTNLTPGAIPKVPNPTTRQPLINEEEELGCTGNPGTCKQCQADPLSTLFCTTVANKEKEAEEAEKADKAEKAKHPEKTTTPEHPESSNSTPAPVVHGNSMYIPCSDAYKTLSRHKKFNTVDFSTLVGKLTTRGMQVEVQSVADVLRELDRNIYN